MIDRLTIQAQRDELHAAICRARLAYADLEIARDQAISGLAELTRHLDGMAGGLQALDSVLQIEDSEMVTNDQALV